MSYSRRTMLRVSAGGLASVVGYSSGVAAQSQDEGNTTSGSGDRPTAQVVLSFDKGVGSTNSVAKPLMDQYGYPGVIGIVTGRIEPTSDDPEELSVTELQAMQRDGWEVASHTVDHTDLVDASASEVRDQCRESRQFIADNGLLPPESTLVYPDNAVNESVAQIAAEYYDYGFGGDEDPTDGIDDPMRIDRAAGHEPSEAREQIDRAIDQGGVSVLMFHRVGIFEDPQDNDTSEAEFAELMSYIDEQGPALEVVTASQLSAAGAGVTSTPSGSPSGDSDQPGTR